MRTVMQRNRAAIVRYNLVIIDLLDICLPMPNVRHASCVCLFFFGESFCILSDVRWIDAGEKGRMIVVEKMQCYAIALNTSIGVRHGRMTVKWSGDCVSGEIDILNHKEAFKGCVKEDGECRIKGRIVSLTKVLPYDAEGTLTADKAELKVQTEKDRFELNGVPLKMEGEL